MTNKRMPLIRTLCIAFAVAVLRVSSAPVSSTDSIANDEMVFGSKDLSTNQKATSSNTDVDSLKHEVQPKQQFPAKSPSKVMLNRVPDLLENTEHLTPLERLENDQKPMATSLRNANQGEDSFLEEDEEEVERKEKKGADEEVPSAMAYNDGYEKWQDLLMDPRIQAYLASNEEQQMADERSRAIEESLYSQALADYLIRTGEFDRTLEDLVATGAMTPRDAALYRQTIDLEYGRPQLPIEYTPQVVGVPEVTYDDAAPLENAYDAENYIQSIPPVDYSADYLNLPVPPESLLQQAEDDSSDEEQTEDADELLRKLIGNIVQHERSQTSDDMSSSASSETSVQSNDHIRSLPVSGMSSESKTGDVAVVKELESLPATGGKKLDASGTEEEKQLEEMRNRTRPQKSKQDNRTNPAKDGH